MNKVILIGNLSKEPELKKMTNGTSYCNFSIAVQREYKDNKGNRDADFFNCMAWRTLAENIARYCTKGTKVCVTGAVQNRAYKDRSGAQRIVTEIHAESVEFLNNAKTKEAASGAVDEGLKPVDDDFLPF